MSRRRRYKPVLKKNSSFTLNITSMTDMFTLLLVFLLQSYNTSEVQLEPVKDLRLPASSTPLNPNDGLRISISKVLLQIDKKDILEIRDNKFDSKDLDPNDPNFILPLFAELDRYMKDSNAKKIVKEGRILLLADASLPYNVLRKIMYTSSMAGFSQLKLVTTVGN